MLIRVLVMESRRASVSPPRVLPATPVAPLVQGNLQGNTPVARRLRSQSSAPAAAGTDDMGGVSPSPGRCRALGRSVCIRADFPQPMTHEQVMGRLCTKCDVCKNVPRYQTCADKTCAGHGQHIDDMVQHLVTCHPIEQQEVLAEAARVGICEVCGWAQEGVGVGHRHCAGRYGAKLHRGAPGATDMEIIITDISTTVWVTMTTVRKACADFDKIATFEHVRAPQYRCHRHPVMSMVFIDRVRAIALKIFSVINPPRSSGKSTDRRAARELQGASKLIIMLPAMLTFVDDDVAEMASGHVVNVLRLVNERAARFISGGFESLFRELIEMNSRARQSAPREPGAVVQEKVARRKFKQARSVLAADAGGRDLPTMIPTDRALKHFESQYMEESRQPPTDDQYVDGCSFRESQARQLSDMIGSPDELITSAKQVKAAMKKVDRDAAAGPSGANAASALMLYGSDELCSELAEWISSLSRCGVDGLEDADPVDVRIRDTFICRPAMAMTKPGKDSARVIEPESTWAKVIGGAMLLSALLPMKEYFGPHQLAFKRTDGLISAAKLVQTAMEASDVDIRHYLDGRDTEFDGTMVAFMFDKKEMYPRTDRRQLPDDLVQQCSHQEYGGAFRQILRAFLFFFGNSFSVHHYHGVSDFNVEHAERYFTEYVSNQGVGIGSILSSLLAFLKQHLALLQVMRGQVSKAVFATAADNCFIVGAASDVA